MYCSVQVLPFHISTRGTEAPDDWDAEPTATQAVGAVQETPSKMLFPLPGLGVDWTLHDVPFQRSASVASGAKLVGRNTPTATHAELELQAMPVSPWVKPGFGADCTLHELPFHTSTTRPDLALPTAVQRVPLVQATPLNPSQTLSGFCVDWIAHELPFHLSARVYVMSR